MPNMQQAKFSLSPPLIDFLNHHQAYGYRDRSEMVRSALQHFRDELELQSLRRGLCRRPRTADAYRGNQRLTGELGELTSQEMRRIDDALKTVFALK